MKDYATEQQDSKSVPTIIPFPLNRSASVSQTDVEQLLYDALNYPSSEMTLKKIIEGAVFEAWMKAHSMDAIRVNDSFDAIYICELQPDPVILSDLIMLKQYAGIFDISETVTFDDEWGD